MTLSQNGIKKPLNRPPVPYSASTCAATRLKPFCLKNPKINVNEIPCLQILIFDKHQTFNFGGCFAYVFLK